jgi:hypothetical protein
MNVLIISDDPLRKSFCQILSLKQSIEDLIRKQVDLIAFSSDGVFLNQKRMSRDLSTDAILNTLRNTLKRKAYLVCIISLRLKYFKRVFLEGWNILDLIEKTSPQATVFIFGASSILNNVQIEQKVQPIFFYSRHGVAKLTKEFKNEIIRRIKAIKPKW